MANATVTLPDCCIPSPGAGAAEKVYCLSMLGGQKPGQQHNGKVARCWDDLAGESRKKVKALTQWMMDCGMNPDDLDQQVSEAQEAARAVIQAKAQAQAAAGS